MDKLKCLMYQGHGHHYRLKTNKRILQAAAVSSLQLTNRTQLNKCMSKHEKRPSFSGGTKNKLMDRIREDALHATQTQFKSAFANPVYDFDILCVTCQNLTRVSWKNKIRKTQMEIWRIKEWLWQNQVILFGEDTGKLYLVTRLARRVWSSKSLSGSRLSQMRFWLDRTATPWHTHREHSTSSTWNTTCQHFIQQQLH